MPEIARNPVFNRFGSIDLEFQHPRFGWVPYTANPNDKDGFGRGLFEAASRGAFGEVAPYPLTPEEQKQEDRRLMLLSRPQTLLMLVEQGFITEAEALAASSSLPATVEAAIAQLPAQQRTELRIRWVSFEFVPRTDAFITLFASIPTPPLTDEQLDALFEAYAQR